jgi:genome maintenance exonuclease 1
MAGRVDCVAEYNGKLSIIDFKSSKSAKKAEWIEGYFAQATAYAIMWQEMTGEPIDQVVILVSSMDGTHQEFVRKSIDYVPRLKEMIDGYYSSSNAV